MNQTKSSGSLLLMRGRALGKGGEKVTSLPFLLPAFPSCFANWLKSSHRLSREYCEHKKCYYDQIIDINFLHFRVQYDFLTYLAKFQSITNIRSHSFFTFISENLRPPLLDLVPRLGCELEKMTSFSQKYLTG